MHFFNREDLPDILNVANLTGRGAEIGVDEGIHANSILSKWNGHKLFLIDAWSPIESMQGTSFLYKNSSIGKVRSIKDSRKVIIQGMSSEIAESLNEELDFVYIDAGHGYCDVKEDLKCWNQKVKGIVSGHDYLFKYMRLDGKEESGLHIGVQSAVDRFYANKAVRFTCRDEFPSWYVWNKEEETTIAVYSCAFDDYPGKYLAVDNHSKYCEKWNLPYQMEYPRELHWHKVARFKDLIESGEREEDWLFWIDADALFTNFSKSINGIVSGCPFAMIVGWADPWGANTGTFAIRNNKKGFDILNEWLGKKEEFNTPESVYDNGAFQDLISKRRNFAEKIEVVNHRIINSYPQFNMWGPTDLIAHFPGSGPRRLDLMRHFSEWVKDS